MTFVTNVHNIIDNDNSRTGSLTNGSTFTGTWSDYLFYEFVLISITSVENSASNGVSIEWNHIASGSGIFTETLSVSGNDPLDLRINKKARYFRIVYTQGSTTGDVDIQTIKNVGTPQKNIVESVNNTTNTTLTASSTFTGIIDDVINFNEIIINIFGRPGVVAGDGSNASGSLFIEFSPDGTNWDVSIPNFVKDPSLVIPIPLIFVLRYFRVRYLNDGGSAAITALGLSDTPGTPTNQTEFRLTTYFIPQATKELTRTLDQNIGGSDPVLLSRSVITGRNPTGNFGNVILNNANGLVVADFNLEVAQGVTPCFENVHVNGINEDITSASDPEDVWFNGGLYTGQPTTAPELIQVFSSSGSDTSLGTGMRTIEIFGLKTSTSTAEESEIITLNGITPAPSVSTWYRVYKAIGRTYGTNGSNVGSITIRHAVTTADVFAVIKPQIGISAVCAYTVPSGVTAYIQSIYIVLGRANGSAASGKVSIRIKPNTTANVKNAIRVYGITTSSPINPPLEYPIILEENTDLIVRVDEVSETNTQFVSSDLEILLIQ